MSADVQVLGAGFTGRLIARELRRRGVEVALIDPQPDAAASAVASGVALPLTPEHPHRLELALGTARARELVAFGLAGLRLLPGYAPCGVDLAEDAEPALPAAARLGLQVEGLDEGYRILDAGEVDLVALNAALASPTLPEPVPAEMTVHASGWRTSDPWLADKLTPVRWSATDFAGPALPRPHISRQFHLFCCGALRCFGARFASPHLEVGETRATPQPSVLALLERLARQSFPTLGLPRRSVAGIVAESCDGLPILGPIPGRPRELVCAGLGVSGLAFAAAAARAIADWVLEGRAEVPDTLSSWRFI